MDRKRVIRLSSGKTLLEVNRKNLKLVVGQVKISERIYHVDFLVSLQAKADRHFYLVTPNAI